MIAAQGFSSGLPLPQEPSGMLVLPAILVYCSLSAVVMEYTYRFGLIKDEKDTATSKTIQYLVLFVGARGLARFQALRQSGILGVISVVYLVLPSQLTDIKHQDKSMLDFFVQIVDCIANRGVVLWLIGQIESFTGVSSLFPNIFFFLGVLMWNPLARVAKLTTCASVFTFFTARQIVQVLQRRLSDAVCAVLLTSILVCVLLNGDNTSVFVNMLVLSSGVIFTNWLEKWIRNWSQESDWMIVYLVVFVILEAVGKKIKEQIKNTTKEEEQQGAMILEVATSGIAHHHALLGLPIVDDASGSH